MQNINDRGDGQKKDATYRNFPSGSGVAYRHGIIYCDTSLNIFAIGDVIFGMNFVETFCITSKKCSF